MTSDVTGQAKPRDVLPSDALTMPARYYTDPSIFSREMERFYFGMWICAGRASEIASAGDFFVREVVGQSIVVTRGEDDEVRAFYNTCRHRGTKYCAEEHGHFTGRIQCPYHLWTYRLDGTLANAPHMAEVPHFRKEDHSLGAVACEIWDGHVFLNFSSRPAPLASQLATLPSKFAPWRMQDLRRGARIVYDLRTNWKLVLLNYSECLHCPNVHPVLNQLSHYLSGENEPLQPTYMGGRMDLRAGVETMSMDGLCRRRYLPGVSEEDRRRVYYYALFPNFLLSLHPDYMMTHTIWPIAPDQTRIICEWHFHPDELATPGFSADDVVAFWDMTNKQDWHVCELSQAGISSRGYRPGPYSNREDLLYQFDRYILRELGQL
jgi:phenylpropionate dioxygenase-like ring-hydroxylating dioxygenase large terminal subunit